MIMIPRRESFSGSLPRQLGSFSYTHPISYSGKHTGVQGSKVKPIVLSFYKKWVLQGSDIVYGWRSTTPR